MPWGRDRAVGTVLLAVARRENGSARPGRTAGRPRRLRRGSRWWRDAWALLLVSAVLEAAVWASALAASEGLSRPVPAAVFLVAGTLSMVGLARAVRTIPIGTAYAVWTGLGAALTVTWAMTTGGEAFSVVKVALLAGIVAAVVGLKVLGHEPARSGRSADGPARRR